MDRAAYAAFMGLALATALVVRRWFVPKPAEYVALPPWKRAGIGAAAFLGGVLGAKLPFVLAGEEGLFSGTAWLADGKTVVAGFGLGYLAVELAKAAMRVRVKTGDTFALPLACAMAVGRWGCFFNGCCYGTHSELPWAVRFGDVSRHPTQLYEVAFHAAMAAALVWLARRDLLRRQRLKLYLIGYAAFRFLVEFIRPEPAWWLGLSVYQWAALALIPPLAWQWRLDARAAPAAAASATSAGCRA
jgi:phosphatidylglycerol:prolipoprotein diacylglycerol transferase